MAKEIVQDLIKMKNRFQFILFTLFIALLLSNKDVNGQNCPGLNVIGSFYNLPSNSAPNYTTAQANGLCYELRPPYPAQVCFEYMVPFSDTVRATFHLKACGSQSSIGTGTYSAGCSGTSSTNATFIGMSTYNNSCNLISNNISVGHCAGAVPGDIMTVCFDLNTSSACDPIIICPMLFCNTSICSTGLPVELTSFEVTCEENNSKLSWTTSSEINNDYFVIEKSYDGLLFEKIGTKKGFGNSSVVIDYSFKDDDVKSGLSYYRLKQIDFNGEYSYSNIRVSKCSSNSFNVYPNPATNTLNFDWENLNDEVVDILITNTMGKVIMNKRINKTLASINIERLKKGLYQIQIIETNNNRSTLKFIKQ
jgi:hypothetical protein